MERKYSFDLKNIVEQKVHECAESLGLDSKHTKVFLYTIIKYRSKILDEIFINMNINVDDLLKEISSIDVPDMVIADPKTNKTNNSYHDVHINSLLINAEKESKSMKHDEICPEHVILACLSYKGENKNVLATKSLMQKYGVSLKEYTNHLYIAIYEKNLEDLNKNNKKEKKNDSKSKNMQLEEEKDPVVRTKKTENNLIDLGYIRNINEQVKSSPEIFIGREEDIERAINILCRKQKRNLMIIGEPGIGKTAIVKAIVQKIVDKNVPEKLIDKNFYQIYLDNIVAGTKFRGEFEKKFKDIIDFVSMKKEVSESMPVLFIDEIHTLVGAGAAEGGLDASGILKPRISSGEVQCIGATTIEEYRKKIMSDTALSRRFTNIFIEEPNKDDTIEIIKGIKSEYENYHNVFINEEVILEIVSLANKYIKNRFFPDKAIDILDESCVKAIYYHNKKDKKSKKTKDNRIVVTKEIVREVLTDYTKIPLISILSEERKKMSNLSNTIKKSIVGQDEAIKKVVSSIHSARAGFTDPDKPIATFLFLGSTGTGKTYFSKTLSNEIFGTDKIIRIDMSEYMEKSSITRLIGSPPGYVGYEEAGQLTEEVRNRPYSLILIDEIEKAHPSIFNLFLQVFDEGRLTDASGRFIDFRNTIIIMTSNIGIAGMKSENKKVGFTVPENIKEHEKIEEYLIGKVKNFFSPEFYNRIDETVVFKNISKEVAEQIFFIEFEKTKDRIKSCGYKISLSECAKDFLVKNGFDDFYGARPIKRTIKKYIEQPLATMAINGDLKEGDEVVIEKKDSLLELSFCVNKK